MDTGWATCVCHFQISPQPFIPISCMCYALNWWPEQTVLTSSGRMKTMRKHRYQASSVLNRTIRCCFLKSPYRCRRNRARKKTTTISMASAAPLILLLYPAQQRHLGNQAGGKNRDTIYKFKICFKKQNTIMFVLWLPRTHSNFPLSASLWQKPVWRLCSLWKTLLFFFSRARQNERKTMCPRSEAVQLRGHIIFPWHERWTMTMCTSNVQILFIQFYVRNVFRWCE